MAPIPKKLRDQLAANPYYGRCARHKDGHCAGRVTWEHAILYAGRQVQEAWAIIPLCWYHHLGAGMNKVLNIRLAMSRASAEDRAKYPRLNWATLRL